MIMMMMMTTDSTLAAGLDRSSTTVRAGGGGERQQASTPRGGRRGRQATGFCGASHDIFPHRTALPSMTLHYTTVLYVAYLRRSSGGYSVAFLGDAARPGVLVSIGADLTFAVSCLVSCAQKRDTSFLSGSVADSCVTTFVSGRADRGSVAPGVDRVTWVWALRSDV